MYSFDTLNLSSPVAMLLFSKRSYLLVAGPGCQAMGQKTNQNPCFLQLHLGPWQCSQLQNCLEDVIWNFIVVGLAGFLVLLRVILLCVVFTLPFSGTAFRRKPEEGNNRCLDYSCTFHLRSAPGGTRGPPRLSSLWNDRSGCFYARADSLTGIFPSV